MRYYLLLVLLLPVVAAASSTPSEKIIHDRFIVQSVARQLDLDSASELFRQAQHILYKKNPAATDYPKALARLMTEFKFLRRLKDEQVVLGFLDQAIVAGKLKADARLPGIRFKLAEGVKQLEADDWDKARPLVTDVVEQLDREIMPEYLKQAPDFFFGAGDRVIASVGKRLKAQGIEAAPAEVFEKAGIRKRANVYWGYRPFAAIRFLVIHHTVEENLKDIYKRHTEAGHFDESGAPFISYHFLITQEGVIIPLNHLEDKVWHAREANFNGIGIAMIGNREEKPVPPAQAKALRALVSGLRAEFKFGPQAVKGHGALVEYGNDSVCPGRFGRDALKKFTAD